MARMTPWLATKLGILFCLLCQPIFWPSLANTKEFSATSDAGSLEIRVASLRSQAHGIIKRQTKRNTEAEQSAYRYPFVAIIIDDIGNNPDLGNRAISLPGPVTYAILPHTPSGFQLAKKAYYTGKEVMLHAPMESVHKKSLGQGGLTLSMSKEEFLTTLRDNLSQVPFLAGVNNHMGSLLTQHSEPMAWFMDEIKNRDMYFVDSRTSPASIAANVASELDIPYLIRDVFLDNEQSLWSIHKAFNQLLSIARNEGSAIAIGHPYPATLSYLAEAIPTLEKQGITLIPVSEMLTIQSRKTLRYLDPPKPTETQTAESNSNREEESAI